MICLVIDYDFILKILNLKFFIFENNWVFKWLRMLLLVYFFGILKFIFVICSRLFGWIIVGIKFVFVLICIF